MQNNIPGQPLSSTDLRRFYGSKEGFMTVDDSLTSFSLPLPYDRKGMKNRYKN